MAKRGRKDKMEQNSWQIYRVVARIKIRHHSIREAADVFAAAGGIF